MARKKKDADPSPLSTPDKIEILCGNIRRHIQSTLGKDPDMPDTFACYMGLAHAVRDRLIENWIATQRVGYSALTKRVYYLSMEFLPGRFLMNYLANLNMLEEAREAVKTLGFDLDELEEEEWDAGFGNGGLGRLASCFLDSVASLNIPCYGYGIRYDYGIFFQDMQNGYQKEHCDNWSRRGTPWEIQRHDYLVNIRFYGRSEAYESRDGTVRYQWVGGETLMALACDFLIPGFGTDYVTNMRLWSARSSREFNLENFNQGDYIGAVEAKVRSENISKVLYPSDEAREGKELRLKQQYFFVAATLVDIIRRHKKQNPSFVDFPEFVAIQLNDTHPSIAIAELMRILMDEEGLAWDEAFDICERTFAYTNHTVLPEALETWPVDLLGKVLPRHLEIIFEINRRFLEKVAKVFPESPQLLSEMSIIQEGDQRQVRMAHLAIIGSHSVNGVARLHSEILKDHLFKNFNRVFPGKIKNVTNGVTPRRWLYQCNPLLADLISSAIGKDWVTHLDELKKLIPHAEDPQFRKAWLDTKYENKRHLARYVLRKIGTGINPETLFDVHVKRMHEYKRQLLNLLHVVTLYNRMKNIPNFQTVPRTVFFAGKAAPGYFRAKLIIKLITSVAGVVNNDRALKGMLKVVFLPNYCISQAEKIIPAADLSEQISTAGMEASGTGNMKLSLNGALTIGTLDGANVEIMEEVRLENIFIFGMNTEEVAESRHQGYSPFAHYAEDPELKLVLDMIGSGFFSPGEPELFTPVVHSLIYHGDYYRLLADYRSYIQAQERVSELYANKEEWARRSILNTANMGKFSSDRAILDYAQNIWHVDRLLL
ncbi:MAG: glycogen/starch/alpha-glucan phosphorylase [Desulfobacteraceae bacterium]|nr:glycogen/starch/alpha-glucan phosphorylase [Desulfobacteraceae bacterium]